MTPSDVNLPGVYSPGEYTVGLWVSRDPKSYLVRLRLPDGGLIDIARYRTRFFAQRMVDRSWKLAQ